MKWVDSKQLKQCSKEFERFDKIMNNLNALRMAVSVIETGIVTDAAAVVLAS